MSPVIIWGCKVSNLVRPIVPQPILDRFGDLDNVCTTDEAVMWLSDKDSRWCLYHRGFLYEDAKKQTIAGRLAKAKRIIFYGAYVANQVHLFQRCVDGTCFYVAQKQSPLPMRGTHATRFSERH